MLAVGNQLIRIEM